MRPYPLVLLHGFTGSPATFERTRQALTSYDASRLIVPTLPGHGPSEHSMANVESTARAPANPFEATVATLAANLQRSGVTPDNPAVLVGYSLGARLALGLMMQQPAWFRHGVLIGVNPGLTSSDERLARERADASRIHQLRTIGLEAFLTDWQEQPLFDSQRDLPAALVQEQARTRNSHTPEGLATSLETTGLATMPDYWPRLATLQTPTTLVVGEQDPKFRAIAVRALSLFPRASLAVFPHVGHNVPLEAAERLAGLLDELPL